MNDVMELKWPRYALIANLAERLEGRAPWFGKTAVMKYAYLLQELYEVPLGYKFSLYTYGPFSRQVLSDLDFARAIDAVSVDFDEEVGGYRISPGEDSDSIEDRAEDFLQEFDDAIEVVTETFGLLTAQELELVSTIIYVQEDSEEKGRDDDREELIEAVQDIKPHFSRDVIEAAVDELEEEDLI